VVSQDVELLEATLRDNLTFFGTLDVSDDAILDVLDEVGLSAWAAALPDGLDARLDSRALSAGEAQLLAFARVLLSDAGLVLLDEATSRLDPATEATLAAATERALAGRTAVIVAHRLSTLDRVDEICVVHDGRIVEHDLRTTLARDRRSHFAGLLDVAAQTGKVAS
jgi:ATP-binding cassette subfamily B protein